MVNFGKKLAADQVEEWKGYGFPWTWSASEFFLKFSFEQKILFFMFF
jgi:hypothetical protein